MSVVIPVGGVLEEPTQLLLPDTAVNDVVSLAAGLSTIETLTGLIITNEDAAPCVVKVWLTKDSTDRLIFIGSVPAGETITEALKYPLKLFAKSTVRKIKAQAAVAGKVTVTAILTTSSQSSNVS